MHGHDADDQNHLDGVRTRQASDIEILTPVDQLVADNDYYAAATIPGGMYDGNPDDVVTFGVKATFVTSTNLPEAVGYEVAKAVFENFEDFTRLHPAFEHLQKEDMVSDGLSATLHDGAQRYFEEAGLL